MESLRSSIRWEHEPDARGIAQSLLKVLTKIVMRLPDEQNGRFGIGQVPSGLSMYHELGAARCTAIRAGSRTQQVHAGREVSYVVRTGTEFHRSPPGDVEQAAWA